MSEEIYKKITIFAHVDAPGFPEEFIQYITRKQPEAKIIFIKFPFFLSKEKSVLCEEYIAQTSRCLARSAIRFMRPEPLAYCKDFIYALYYGLRFARHSDLVICTNNLLCLAAILLKPIKGFKKIVYQIVDFSPKRFNNRVLNAVFYAIDRFCCCHADVLWPFDSRIIEARVEFGYLDPSRIAKWYPVGFGNHALSLRHKFRANTSPKRLVYLGGLFGFKGAGLFVDIIKILKRRYSDIHLDLIGKGDRDTEIKREIEKQGVCQHITLHGYIADNNAVHEILLSCGIALAPYQPSKENIANFADAAKVKVYLGCGLPLVITAVPPIHKILLQERAGLTADFDAMNFTQKLDYFIENPTVHDEFRRNAQNLGLKYDWNNVLNQALSQL